MDIVITRDDFRTLTKIVIANLIHTSLVQNASMTTMHATKKIVQNKAQSYTERTPRDDFIPLTIETYGCLHPHFDSFLTSYVHVNIIHH